MLTRRYQLLLLAAIVLAAYYPAVLADFSRIDDAQLAESYRNMQDWSFWRTFVPFQNDVLYYRPFIGLSFLIDKYFLGLAPGLMHLENILLHLLNAVLVYFLTLQIVPSQDRSKSLLPLIAACLFALHPINTESVNWISGRTDSLAGVFILMSALFLLKYGEVRKRTYLTLSLLTFLGGVFTKENSLAFLPGALLMIHVHHLDGQPGKLAEPLQKRTFFNHEMKLILGGLVVVFFFIAIRVFAFSSHVSRLGMTFRILFDDWMHTLFVSLKAFSFYMKKVVMPYPLNFAIVEVDPLYEVLAVPVVAICLFIASRRTQLSAVFTTGIFLITPAFLLAFGQIAWTPYAERYLYIPSAFLVSSSVVYLGGRLANYSVAGKRAALLLLLMIMFIGTLNRSIVWQNDVKLCKDTIEESPRARNIRLVYSGLLTGKGDYVEALRQLEIGKELPSLAYDERFDLNMAEIYYRQGRLDDAIAVSELALKNSGGQSALALGYLADLMEIKKNTSTERSEKDLMNRRILAYNQALYKINHDPRLLYSLGVTAAALGENTKALGLFRQAMNNLNNDDLYKIKAKNKIAEINTISSRNVQTDEY